MPLIVAGNQYNKVEVNTKTLDIIISDIINKVPEPNVVLFNDIDLSHEEAMLCLQT